MIGQLGRATWINAVLVRSRPRSTRNPLSIKRQRRTIAAFRKRNQMRAELQQRNYAEIECQPSPAAKNRSTRLRHAINPFARVDQRPTGSDREDVDPSGCRLPADLRLLVVSVQAIRLAEVIDDPPRPARQPGLSSRPDPDRPNCASLADFYQSPVTL
jgi:hypothetical protein